MRALVGALLLVALACAGGQSGEEGAQPSQRLLHTVAVTNKTGGSLSVSTAGGKKWTIILDRACLPIYNGDIAGGGRVRLFFRPIAESGFVVEITSRDIPGWEIYVSPWPDTRQFDIISMSPAPMCEPTHD